MGCWGASICWQLATVHGIQAHGAPADKIDACDCWAGERQLRWRFREVAATICWYLLVFAGVEEGSPACAGLCRV